MINHCKINPDKKYNRQEVVKKNAEILNMDIPDYRHLFSFGFYVNNENSMGFSIYDLTDTLNFDRGIEEECVNFIDNHIYHFVPQLYSHSLSHIAVLKNGNIEVFKYVNCEKGDKIEGVIKFYLPFIKNNPKRNNIIKQIKNYRKYGFYHIIDEQSDVICK